MHGTYEIVDDRSALSFERRLAHSVERVWRAVSEPGELAHWFPSAMSGELRIAESDGGATFVLDLPIQLPSGSHPEPEAEPTPYMS